MKFILGEWKFGTLLGLYTSYGLRAVWLGTHTSDLIEAVHQRFPNAQQVSNTILHNDLQALILHADKPTHPYQGPLDVQGTPFQKAVWEVLCTIPPGKVISYTEVATRIKKPNAYRAVAQACGANVLPLVIPCHRVVGKRGLGGYHFGISLKRDLLEHEQWVTSRLK